jgi:hypothetical protein
VWVFIPDDAELIALFTGDIIGDHKDKGDWRGPKKGTGTLTNKIGSKKGTGTLTNIKIEIRPVRAMIPPP